MSNFRPIDRDHWRFYPGTSVDEWLPERHLCAGSVVERHLQGLGICGR